jgi:hypothetical protein
VPSGKFVDLTGQRFGAWTVLELLPREARDVRYLCRCDCGAERPVLAGNLRTGKSTRCIGCSNRARAAEKAARRPVVRSKPVKPPMPKGPVPEDLTGRKFGEWTVLYYVGPTPSRQHLWKCECSCGNKVMVQAGNLRSGRSKRCKSCGARRRSETRWRAKETGWYRGR